MKIQMKWPLIVICCLTGYAQQKASTSAATSTTAQIIVTGPPYNAQCNGTYDDTAALNAAALAASAGGGIVELPAGTCTTSTGIPLYSFVSYVG